MFDYTTEEEWNPGKIVQLSTNLEKPSPFFFGYDIEEYLFKELELLEHQFDKIFFFTEGNLLALYGQELFEKLNRKYNCLLEILPAGEKCKKFSVLEDICETLVDQGVSKKSLLVSFGGGTVGNLVGLVAGLIYRGIQFIEIPTSMTAQTDSILSNKQAINSSIGKNHFDSGVIQSIFMGFRPTTRRGGGLC